MLRGKLRQNEGDMSPKLLHGIKTLGYLVSSLSVFLLAIVSWDGAQKSTFLMACLLAGATTSIIGMFCRWLSYEIEKRQQAAAMQRRPRQPDKPSPPPGGDPAAGRGMDAR